MRKMLPYPLPQRVYLGCQDEYFNKRPNSAEIRQEKGQTDCLKTRKNRKFFVVLLYPGLPYRSYF